jgi:uncharacterized protein (DUF885 family)
MWRIADGRPIERFPDVSEDAAEDKASQARSFLAKLGTINEATLPHQMALTLKIARFQLEIEAQALDRYWLVQEIGVYPAIFPIGPYGCGYLFSLLLKVFSDFGFVRRSDCDRYLALIEGYAELVDQLRRKLEGQAVRGIRIPRPAIPGMRALVNEQFTAAREALGVAPTRLSRCAAPADFVEEVESRIEGRVIIALAALRDVLDDEYARKAAEEVGIGRFKDGIRLYEGIIAEHVSLPMGIDEIHRAGHEYMAQIEAEMAEIRGAVRYQSKTRFHEYLRSDASWSAGSPAELKRRLESLVQRIEPHLGRLFYRQPAARYRIARLDPSLEQGMTNGYYQEPMAGHPDGVYYFNGADSSERTLATLPSLIFHELVPGHHLHFASQKENEALHPLRQNLFFNAFNEGWAEYAATLAGEIGMYAHPCERYGRLLMDAYVAARLVVDTGLNALGWPLERASAYLQEHTVLSGREIRSEVLRYSTDIPAQGLAYKLGEAKMRELRERVRASRGSEFDIREFHAMVLQSGGMPLQVLDWHVDRMTRTPVAASHSSPRGLVS